MLHGKHDLEERCMAQVPFRLQRVDQVLEGYILVSVSIERHFANTGEKLVEGGVSSEIVSQDEHVQEKTDQGFEPGPVAIGNGGANDDVLQAAVVGEQSREGGLEGHKKGGPGLPAQGFQPVSHPGTDHKGMGASVIGLKRGTGGAGQLQNGRNGRELFPPIVELFLQDLAPEVLPLPISKVAVLKGKRWQG